MNLGEIEGGLYDLLGYQTTPDQLVIRRLRHYVNLTHRRILSMRGMNKLRRAIIPFTSVSGSPLVVMPQSVVHIAVIADRTNRRILDDLELQDIRQRDPGRNFASAIPDAYTIINYAAPVALDPSAAASLFAISDSASDGSGTVVYVEGTLTGGYQHRTSIALNGLTAVNVDAATTTWEHITKFYLSSAAAGNVTLRQASGVGTELARITKGHSACRYTLLELQGIPAAAQTYYADVELRLEDMLFQSDEPLLPEDYHFLMECGAAMREYQKREKWQAYGIEASRMKDGLADLKSYVGRIGGIPHGRGGRHREFSQLGWAFPAGS